MIIVCIFWEVEPLLGQVKDSAKNNYATSDYIEFMSNFINLKLAVNSEVDKLSVLTDNSNIYLSPNASTESRLYFNYRFLSFSIRYLPHWLSGNDDNDIKGQTRGGGFGVNLNFKRWLQEVSYSRIKGYYLENMTDFDPSWVEGDPHIQFPQLENKTFSGITAYKFNPNYSINAVVTQTERQIKSAGSFIPHLLYRYYIIENKVEISAGGSSQKSNNFEVVLGAGYYHTFVLKNDFYISLGATPGVGTVLTKLTTRFATEETVTNQRNAILRLDSRAGAGYNGRRFFAGVYTKFSSASVKQQKTSVINQDNRISVQGFLGYRLNAPKWMKDNVDHVGRIIGK